MRWSVRAARGWRDRALPDRDERTCRGTITGAIGRGWPPAKTRLDWPIALVSPTLQDPTSAVRDLDALTTNASTKDGRTVRAFNPLSRNERLLFEVLLVGEHALHGFTNRDVRQHLAPTPYPLASQAEKQPGQVTRLFRRLHAHGLIAKIPHSRRWRVSLSGRRTMTTAIKLREVAYPSLFATAA